MPPSAFLQSHFNTENPFMIAGLCHDKLDKISTAASRLRNRGVVPQGHGQSESRGSFG